MQITEQISDLCASPPSTSGPSSVRQLMVASWQPSTPLQRVERGTLTLIVTSPRSHTNHDDQQWIFFFSLVNYANDKPADSIFP